MPYNLFGYNPNNFNYYYKQYIDNAPSWGSNPNAQINTGFLGASNMSSVNFSQGQSEYNNAIPHGYAQLQLPHYSSYGINTQQQAGQNTQQQAGQNTQDVGIFNKQQSYVKFIEEGIDETSKEEDARTRSKAGVDILNKLHDIKGLKIEDKINFLENEISPSAKNKVHKNEIDKFAAYLKNPFKNPETGMDAGIEVLSDMASAIEADIKEMPNKKAYSGSGREGERIEVPSHSGFTKYNPNDPKDVLLSNRSNVLADSISPLLNPMSYSNLSKELEKLYANFGNSIRYDDYIQEAFDNLLDKKRYKDFDFQNSKSEGDSLLASLDYHNVNRKKTNTLGYGYIRGLVDDNGLPFTNSAFNAGKLPLTHDKLTINQYSENMRSLYSDLKNRLSSKEIWKNARQERQERERKTEKEIREEAEKSWDKEREKKRDNQLNDYLERDKNTSIKEKLQKLGLNESEAAKAGELMENLVSGLEGTESLKGDDIVVYERVAPLLYELEVKTPNQDRVLRRYSDDVEFDWEEGQRNFFDRIEANKKERAREEIKKDVITNFVNTANESSILDDTKEKIKNLLAEKGLFLNDNEIKNDILDVAQEVQAIAEARKKAIEEEYTRKVENYKAKSKQEKEQAIAEAKAEWNRRSSTMPRDREAEKGLHRYDSTEMTEAELEARKKAIEEEYTRKVENYKAKSKQEKEQAIAEAKAEWNRRSSTMPRDREAEKGLHRYDSTEMTEAELEARKKAIEEEYTRKVENYKAKSKQEKEQAIAEAKAEWNRRSSTMPRDREAEKGLHRYDSTETPDPEFLYNNLKNTVNFSAISNKERKDKYKSLTSLKNQIIERYNSQFWSLFKKKSYVTEKDIERELMIEYNTFSILNWAQGNQKYIENAIYEENKEFEPTYKKIANKIEESREFPRRAKEELKTDLENIAAVGGVVGKAVGVVGKAVGGVVGKAVGAMLPRDREAEKGLHRYDSTEMTEAELEARKKAINELLLGKKEMLDPNNLSGKITKDLIKDVWENSTPEEKKAYQVSINKYLKSLVPQGDTKEKWEAKGLEWPLDRPVWKKIEASKITPSFNAVDLSHIQMNEQQVTNSIKAVFPEAQSLSQVIAKSSTIMRDYADTRYAGISANEFVDSTYSVGTDLRGNYLGIMDSTEINDPNLKYYFNYYHPDFSFRRCIQAAIYQRDQNQKPYYINSSVYPIATASDHNYNNNKISIYAAQNGKIFYINWIKGVEDFFDGLFNYEKIRRLYGLIIPSKRDAFPELGGDMYRLPAYATQMLKEIEESSIPTWIKQAVSNGANFEDFIGAARTNKAPPDTAKYNQWESAKATLQENQKQALELYRVKEQLNAAGGIFGAILGAILGAGIGYITGGAGFFIVGGAIGSSIGGTKEYTSSSEVVKDIEILEKEAYKVYNKKITLENDIIRDIINK